MTRRRRALRLIAVLGLLSAAFFAAVPWLACSSFGRVNGTLDGYATMLRICTVGLFPPGTETALSGLPLPGFTGPYWGSLIVGVVYLVAASYVAVSKRL